MFLTKNGVEVDADDDVAFDLVTSVATGRSTRSARSRRRKLLAPLAPDLAEFWPPLRQPADDELALGTWPGDDCDNGPSIFGPAAQDVGLTADTIPRDLRGSFASLLIFEGLNVLEVAAQLGHKPSTCLDIYGRLFEEFDPARRRPAVEVIEEARMTARDGALPTGYPGGLDGEDSSGPAAVGDAH